MRFPEDSAFAKVDESQLERTISSWKRRAQFCSPRQTQWVVQRRSVTFGDHEHSEGDQNKHSYTSRTLEEESDDEAGKCRRQTSPGINAANRTRPRSS